MDERGLDRLLASGIPSGNETFRDELLARCLDVLCSDNDSALLADDDLEMLAAAGLPGELPTTGRQRLDRR